VTLEQLEDKTVTAERMIRERAKFDQALIDILIALNLYHSLAEWYAIGDELI
jgi:hypothetical protein